MVETPVTYAVGDVTITRVLEKEILDFTPEYLFPEWEPALVQEHQEWMPSSCWDDAREHFVLSTHTWLLKARAHTILIDTGIGNDKKRKLPGFDHLKEPYLERLAAVGVVPEAVDYVLLTHLHTDHVGWNTRFLNGRWVPTFPNAKYVFAKVEDEYFSGPGGRDRPNGAELIDGLVFNPTPGHSVGHMSISLRSGGQEALFGGDVMHLPVQVYRPDWSSVFSASPERGRLSRLWALERAAERHALFFLVRTSPAALPDSSNAITTGSVGAGFEVILPILSSTRFNGLHDPARAFACR